MSENSKHIPIEVFRQSLNDNSPTPLKIFLAKNFSFLPESIQSLPFVRNIFVLSRIADISSEFAQSRELYPFEADLFAYFFFKRFVDLSGKNNSVFSNNAHSDTPTQVSTQLAEISTLRLAQENRELSFDEKVSFFLKYIGIISRKSQEFATSLQQGTNVDELEQIFSELVESLEDHRPGSGNLLNLRYKINPSYSFSVTSS